MQLQILLISAALISALPSGRPAANTSPSYPRGIVKTVTESTIEDSSQESDHSQSSYVKGGNLVIPGKKRFRYKKSGTAKKSSSKDSSSTESTKTTHIKSSLA
ncbi:hypothetical protein DSO57_1021188 [Entomophthora muscae]|uniref:Uncharacterized protein n=1 Tax=Entomophthora muscae TaxID=34485 RepID=A0ACC2T3F2_9FUNG|nr:hypothetical protein DSO57_1021188 [Entomophthora muscae]